MYGSIVLSLDGFTNAVFCYTEIIITNYYREPLFWFSWIIPGKMLIFLPKNMRELSKTQKKPKNVTKPKYFSQSVTKEIVYTRVRK